MVNKKSCIAVLVIVLVFGLVLVNCDNGTNNSNNSDKDSIRIISVDPSGDLTDGILQEFKITIEYVLFTQEKGEISILVTSNDTPNALKSIPETHTVIDKGSGTKNFDVTVLTKNWNSEGEFIIGAMLAPYPNINSFESLAGDMKRLLFK